MKIQQKTLVAALAAACLGWGAVPAVAQSPSRVAATAQAQASAHPEHSRMQRHRGERGMHGKKAHEQHQAALKEKLHITPAQQVAWDSFTAAMQSQPHARLDRAEMAGLSTPERIDRMRAQRAQHAAAADQRGEAIKAFYAALNAEQQKIFDTEGLRHGSKGKHRMHRHAGGGHGAHS